MTDYIIQFQQDVESGGCLGSDGTSLIIKVFYQGIGVLYSPPCIPAGICWNLGDSKNSAELLFPFHGILADSRMAMESPEWNRPEQNPRNFF